MVDVSADGPFMSGWGPPEHGRGISFRWVNADSARMIVTVDHPWSALRIWHRFLPSIHHDVLLTVNDGADEPARGMLRWFGAGLRIQRVEFDREVRAGRIELGFWPVQTSLADPGGQRLSVALAGLAAESGRSPEKARTRWLAAHR